MKKFLFTLIAFLCFSGACLAEQTLPPLYENTFDGDLSGYQTERTEPKYSSASIVTEDGNNVLDIAAAINGFGGGYPVDIRSSAALPCGENYTLSLRAKIVGNYEYAGIIFRKENDGKFNALVLDAYTKTFCISKNTLYTNTSYIANTRKSYSLVSAFDPKEWNSYVLKLTGNNIKVYVNNTLVLDYTDNEENIYKTSAAGGGVLTSVSRESHFYIDDVKAITDDLLITGCYELTEDSERDLTENPYDVKVLPIGFKLSLYEPISDISIDIIEDGSETIIPAAVTELTDNYVIFKPKMRLSEGKTYSISIKEAVNFSEERYDGFSEIIFSTESQIVTAEAAFNDNILEISAVSSDTARINSVVAVAALYKDKELAEVHSCKSIASAEGLFDIAPIAFNNTGDELAIYIWSDFIGTKMYTKPLIIEVTE